jgi:leucyl/phenylalanyl-tRNA--protein transferase
MVSSGVELDPGMVLRAYRIGAFPMADPATGSISWYAPDPRAVIDLERMSIPRSLRTVIRRGTFEVRWDTAFLQVMSGCASRPETWISPEIMRAYGDLHRDGWAHSVECWRNGILVGGLYGVAIGGAFFGESMFSLETNASKVAFAALIERMLSRGFVLLDTQFLTPHLERFGAVEIPRTEYLRRLHRALQHSCVLVP